MFPMPPPEFFQVRDDQGVVHLINRWMIARVEIQGLESNLDTTARNDSTLNETDLNPIALRVEIISQAAGSVSLGGENALAFLRLYFRTGHMLRP